MTSWEKHRIGDDQRSHDADNLRRPPDGELRDADSRMGRYPTILLLTLLVVSVVNFMDRSLIGIVGESIKQELALSDTELGLVGGGMFTIIYSALGIWSARLADRGWKKRVILWSVMVWCVMTTVVGFSHSFWQLALARVGVAVGEGGVLPVSHALVSQEIHPRRRASAIALLWAGGFIGIALAALLGGWANAAFGWRTTFLIMGPVGLLLVPLIHFTIRDDAAPVGPASAAAPVPKLGLGATLRFLLSVPTYRLLWIAAAVSVMAPQALLIYSGPFFVRSFGLSTSVVGRYVALSLGLSSLIGGLVGGLLFDLLSRRSLRLALTVPACTVLLSSICAIIGYTSNRAGVAALSLFAAQLFFVLSTAPTYTMAQILAPPAMRSTSAAVLNIGIGAVGGALGPLIVGAISDLSRPRYGIHSLSVGLIVLSVVQALGACLFLWTARRADQDIAPIA